jgi:N-acetylglutamate synthase-like GNAT family acetyltransferase
MVLFGNDSEEIVLSSNLLIRRATPVDAGALTAIAHDAKRYWGYPEEWIRHWQEDLTVTPDFVARNQVFVAERESEIIGFYALVILDHCAELEHMWVAPKHIGTGVGKELFIHAMQLAAGDSISEVEISAEPNAESFYQKMGARRIGEVTSEVMGETRQLPRLTIDPTST